MAGNPVLFVRVAGGVDQRMEASPGVSLTLGRSSDSDIVVDEPSVSRRHLRIEVDGPDSTWTLQDLQSTGGTWLDGRRVADRIPVTGDLTVHLGAPDGVRVDLSLVAYDRPDPAPHDATIVVTDDDLRVRFNGRELALPADSGRSFGIGRDTDNAIVTPADNPLAGRRHAEVTFDGRDWILTDTDSARGTYVDGVRVRRQKLAGVVTVWLGEPDAGVKLNFVASGEHRRKVNKRSVIGLAALIVALALVVVGVLLAVGDDDSSNDLVANDPDEIPRLKTSTALVVTMLNTGEVFGSGSGTVLCDDNLVLTNAHVADPTASGQGLLYGSVPLAEDERVKDVFVFLANEADAPVDLRYRARVVASDGYVDAAVLRITHEASAEDLETEEPVFIVGDRIAGTDLELPCVESGVSSELAGKSAADVFGYPGLLRRDNRYTPSVDSDSNEISSFSPDPHIDGVHGWMNLGKEIQGGNSGGLLARDGLIVGVPTQSAFDLVAPDEVAGTAARARPIDLIRPVIEAAQSGGQDYESPHVVHVTGDEAAVMRLVTEANGCNPAVPSVAVRPSGLPRGAHLWLDVFEVFEDGQPTLVSSEQFDWAGDRCLSFPLDELSVGGPGQFVVRLLVGPNLDAELGRVTITVT